VPTQNAEASLAALSEVTGIPIAQCEVLRPDLGCGFGRRGGSQDYTRQAGLIAKQFPGTHVKLIWSREEDQAQDFYRPISQCKLSAGLDESGKLVGLHVRVSGQSINAFLNPAIGRRRQGPPPAAGHVGRGRRRAARLHGAEPAGRVRDAQHARAGRSRGAASTPTRTASTSSASSRSARAPRASTRSSSAAR
jgi:CO/xanthine dehydrogenase Mo-binding subunit